MLLLPLLAVVVASGLVGLATIDFSLVKGPPAQRGYNENKNGIWLAHTWVGDAHGGAEVAELADSLASRGFRYVYVHAGPLERDGAIPSDRFLFAKSFVSAVKSRQPNLQLLAWLGGLNKAGDDGDLDLTDSTVRANIVSAANGFGRQDGWDGIHLDIEPMPTGRMDFLTLLEDLRGGLGSDRLLSVAGQRLWVLPLPLARLPKISDFAWDGSYIRQVADRVDQIAVMTYDSALPRRNLYISYQRAETSALIEALAYHGKVQLLVGVPTYDEERPNFHRDVENMATGLQGVIEALRETPDRRPFVGVSLYAHWTTSAEEWRTYERMWLGAGGP